MRVFVLGAGASKHAGYPLACELGARLVEWSTRHPTSGPNPSWEDPSTLKRYFPCLDNLEVIIEKIENATEGDSFYSARGSMLAGIMETLDAYFEEIRLAGNPSLYREFAQKVVRNGDTILSFNYDVSLEVELCRAGKWQVGD